MNLSKIKSLVMLLLMCVFLTAPLGFSLAAGGGDDGEVHSKGWVSTDTYKVMNFVVLTVGLFFILRKPVGEALNSRIKGIEDQLEELEAKKEEAEKTLAEYNKKISTLDNEAEQILAQYVEQGETAKKRILEEASQSAKKLEEQAKRNIEHEFKDAKKRLQEEIISKALVKAEEIITGSIKTEDQDRLVDDYLNKVVA